MMRILIIIGIVLSLILGVVVACTVLILLLIPLVEIWKIWIANIKNWLEG